MLEFTRATMRLTSLNVRRELAGKNPADGRTASDLKLVVKGGNDLLDKLSPHLRGSFYTVDTDGQGVLLPQALTKLMHPLLDTTALAYDLKCAGERERKLREALRELLDAHDYLFRCGDGLAAESEAMMRADNAETIARRLLATPDSAASPTGGAG